MRMLKSLVAIVAATAFIASCGYEGPTPTVRERQADQNAHAAQAFNFSAGNSERDNIVRRGNLVSQPDLVGYVLLLSMTGQPIAYYTVHGKITSSGKRLEAVDDAHCDVRINDFIQCGTVTDAPSYDGTFGPSDQYVYFWTTNGQYIQWTGPYIYSDQPLELGSRSAAVIAPSTAQH